MPQDAMKHPTCPQCGLVQDYLNKEPVTATGAAASGPICPWCEAENEEQEAEEALDGHA